MFTGIISATQTITDIHHTDSNQIFRIHKPTDWNFAIGESVSINGVCSTVIAEDMETFGVEYMPETLRITNLGEKRAGEFVNIERSMKLDDMVSGYLVSGHVESLGKIAEIVKDGESHLVTVSYPKEFSQYLMHKGGVTIDGIALTVIDPTESANADTAQFSVAIIPHTWEHTTIQYWKKGDHVNLEFDLIAKYVERILQVRENNK